MNGRRSIPERIAAHEAAHAVVATLYGADVEQVTTVREGDCFGCVKYDGSELSDDAMMMLTAAGMAGENLMFGNHDFGGHRALSGEQVPEDERFSPAATFDVAYWVTDRPHPSGERGARASNDLTVLSLYAAHRLHTLDPTRVREQVEAWISAVERELRAVKGPLLDVTEVLIEKQTLTGEEVRALMAGYINQQHRDQ